MGHMTQIANKLHIAVETRQEVAEHVQDSNQWQDYFTTHLEPWNEVGFLVSICSITQRLASSTLVSMMLICMPFGCQLLAVLAHDRARYLSMFPLG